MLLKNILITQNNFPREKHDASCQGPEGPSCPYPIPKAPPLAKAQAPMPALGLSSPALLRLQQLQLQFTEPCPAHGPHPAGPTHRPCPGPVLAHQCPQRGS